MLEQGERRLGRGALESHPEGARPPARLPEPGGPAAADAEGEPVRARIDYAALARHERLRGGAPCGRVAVSPEHEHLAAGEAVREPSLTRLAHPHHLVAEEAGGARADDGVSRLVRRPGLVSPGFECGPLTLSLESQTHRRRLSRSPPDGRATTSHASLAAAQPSPDTRAAGAAPSARSRTRDR